MYKLIGHVDFPTSHDIYTENTPGHCRMSHQVIAERRRYAEIMHHNADSLHCCRATAEG